jgi:hypothetical protein
MNFVEAVEILRDLSEFRIETLRVRPRVVFYDAEKQGYTLWVNEDSLKTDYFGFLKRIVETRQLRIRKHKGYLIIHSSQCF